VLSALEYAPPRDTIVMTELDFPSVRYVYDTLAARLGARIVVVPSDDGIGIDTERLLAAIDERTRLVAISHVLFRSAFIMDVDAICRRAHEVGALVSLDSFHAVGVIPVDVRQSGVDFRSGGERLGRAVADRLAGARAPIRFRTGDGLCGQRVALVEWHAGDTRVVRRHGRTAHRSARRSAADSREERATDVAVDRVGRRARLHGERAA
jgi:hypothetical protein